MKKIIMFFMLVLFSNFVWADYSPQTGIPVLRQENGDLVCVPQGDFDIDGDSIYHIYDFRREGVSESVINMQFERALRLLLRDYSSYLNHGSRSLGVRWGLTDSYDGSGALIFDSSQDYATITNTNSLGFDGSKIYAWSFWVLPTAGGRVQKLISKEVAGVQGYEIRLDEDNRIRFVNPVGWGSYTSSGNLEINNWNSVLVSYSNGLVRIYINGIEQDLVSSGSLSFISDFSSNVGLSVQGDEYFSGYIDNLKIYNKPLGVDKIGIFTQGMNDRLSGDELRGGCYTCAVTPSDDDGNGLTRISNSLCF